VIPRRSPAKPDQSVDGCEVRAEPPLRRVRDPLERARLREAVGGARHDDRVRLAAAQQRAGVAHPALLDVVLAGGDQQRRRGDREQRVGVGLVVPAGHDERVGLPAGGQYRLRALPQPDESDRQAAGLRTCANALSRLGQSTRVASALTVSQVCEPFIRRRVIRHLEKGRVVVLAAGTGNPFFTTDTCAALRATELHADILMKATKVDGVYDSDPKKNPAAKMFHRLTYKQVITDNLRVMDMTAISLAMERKIPILVYNQKKPGSIIRAVTSNEKLGTLITAD